MSGITPHTRRSHSLPFKGRAGVGMGYCEPARSHEYPIPRPTSPLKGEEHTIRRQSSVLLTRGGS